MLEGLALQRGVDGSWDSRVARLRYGFRLLPLTTLTLVWGLWVVALVLFCTAPAWWGRVPGELSTYQLLNRAPAVLAGFTAALCGSIDVDGDPQRLTQGLPLGGVRLWADRLALAIGGLILADATALCAARLYLPLPMGPALGALVPSSALLAAVGLCAGGLWGSWIGLGAVLTYSFLGTIGVLSAQQPPKTPYWRIDPFLATQPPFVPALLRVNRWILLSAAAGLGAVSAHGWSDADRWGAWQSLFRHGGAGVRMATAGWLTAGLLASGAVWVVVRPALQRQPLQPPLPAGLVRVAGTAVVSVADSGGRWFAAVTVPVTVPPLLTRLTVSLPASSVRVDGRRLLPSNRASTGWLFAGRTLGWMRGPATLRVKLDVQPPTLSTKLAWPGLRIDGSALESLRVSWPLGISPAPAGAARCDQRLCWSGRASDLVLMSTAQRGDVGA